MAAVAFDTLKLARALRTEAQMSAEQAEGVSNALAEAMSGAELATKSDLIATETALKSDLASTEAALKSDLAATDASLRSEIAAVRRDLAETKADILKSVMGMVLGALAVNVVAILAGMIGLAKLLGH